jgi:hypothetical protein
VRQSAAKQQKLTNLRSNHQVLDKGKEKKRRRKRAEKRGRVVVKFEILKKRKGNQLCAQTLTRCLMMDLDCVTGLGSHSSTLVIVLVVFLRHLQRDRFRLRYLTGSHSFHGTID